MAKAFLCVLLALLAVIVAQEFDASPVFTSELADSINNNPTAGWKAGKNQFSSWTVGEVKKMLGTKLPRTEAYSAELLKAKPAPSASNLPDNFDSRTAWPGCVHPIRDQMHCGSCWAFSATEALSDRFCIASNGTINVVLSPQDLVSCDWYNQGCNGGILRLSSFYLKHSGVVSDECFPYTSGGGQAPSCPKTCADGKDFKSQKYYAKDYYTVGSALLFWERAKKIQEDIMKYGPVQSGFTVYQDFISYKNGVYRHVSGAQLGGHAIKIVGWGVTDDEHKTPYWLVANSWNTTWGEDGFFKILRGSNECGIEADVYAFTPDTHRVPSK